MLTMSPEAGVATVKVAKPETNEAAVNEEPIPEAGENRATENLATLGGGRGVASAYPAVLTEEPRSTPLVMVTPLEPDWSTQTPGW